MSDYILNIWITKGDDQKIEYYMVGIRGDGIKATEDEIVKKAKEIYKLDKELAVHIIVNK